MQIIYAFDIGFQKVYSKVYLCFPAETLCMHFTGVVIVTTKS